MDKDSLRDQYRKKRLNLGKETVINASTRIQQRIIALRAFASANTVMAYMPIQNEVLTDLLIGECTRQGKTVCLPRILDGQSMEAALLGKMHAARLGILEPISVMPAIDPCEIDLLILPGILFDRKGHRIGFGKGYYDRFMKHLRKDCIRIAPAYHYQILDEIPSFAHDERADILVTEEETIVAVE